MCQRMIRKRQFPAMFDFSEENKFIIYENIDPKNPDAIIKTEGPIIHDIYDKIPKFAEIVSNESHVFLVGGSFP